MTEILYKLQAVEKNFYDATRVTTVIKDISFEIKKGQNVAICGKSGSGKTTLLQLIAGLDAPSTGSIFYKNQNLANLNNNEKTKLRRHQLGFIYQFHHLIPELTAFENILLPALIAKKPIENAKQHALSLLEEVELIEKKNSYPSQLSGGEKQRVAIARALINNPEIILADEPTGSLDVQTANRVFQLLLRTQKLTSAGIIMVTHDIELAKQMDVIISL